jgi:hypothetical protein
LANAGRIGSGQLDQPLRAGQGADFSEDQRTFIVLVFAVLQNLLRVFGIVRKIEAAKPQTEWHGFGGVRGPVPVEESVRIFLERHQPSDGSRI